MRIHLIWRDGYRVSRIFEAYIDRDKAEKALERFVAEDRDQEYTWSVSSITTQDDPK